jgi:hypothetical protein
MDKENRYLELSRLDCSPGVEVKHGGLSYLSWSYAWHLLVSKYPDSTYYFGEPITLPDGTMMVRAGVTVQGLTHEMQLPVLDHRNKPLSQPNSFDYNSAQMRCLVKAIAMHGVGISLYLGDVKQVVEQTQFEKAKSYIDAGDYMALHEFVKGLSEKDQVELFNAAPMGTKTDFKNAHRATMKQAEEFLDSVAEAMGDAVMQDDALLLAETVDELSTYERNAVWARLTPPQQEAVKELRTQQEVSA